MDNSSKSVRERAAEPVWATRLALLFGLPAVVFLSQWAAVRVFTVGFDEVGFFVGCLAAIYLLRTFGATIWSFATGLLMIAANYAAFPQHPEQPDYAIVHMLLWTIAAGYLALRGPAPAEDTLDRRFEPAEGAPAGPILMYGGTLKFEE